MAKELHGHEVRTVPQMGWAGAGNGELLSRMAGQFDVFITIDANLYFQHDMSELQVAVVILSARTNRLPDLKPLVLKVLETLVSIQKGEIIRIST